MRTAPSLETHAERLGGFIVVLPEDRVQVRLETATQGDSLGIHIRVVHGSLADFILAVRCYRDGAIVYATSSHVGPGLHVIPAPRQIDERHIELYDAASGEIVWDEGGTLMRTIAIAMIVQTVELDMSINFDDGSEAVHVKTTWGAAQHLETGGKSEWEEAIQAASIRSKREQLHREQRFLLYRGSADDRRRAVEDIRKILHSAHHGYLKIWDPYFGARDALEFLFYVSDPSMAVLVLTNAEPTPVEKNESKGPTEQNQSARAKKIGALQRALAVLREPQPGTIGLQHLTCRVGTQVSFHDRFIIANGRCWQLGCSFNQIGAVMSTVVEFPYPEMLEAEFDLAWENAKGDEV